MNYRHGDLALVAIKELPTGLKKSKTRILMNGSGGNNHSIDNGIVYLKKIDDFVFGYLEAKNTKLLHIEHGKKIKEKTLKEVKIEDGFYKLIRQQEQTHNGMRPVID